MATLDISTENVDRVAGSIVYDPSNANMSIVDGSGNLATISNSLITANSTYGAYGTISGGLQTIGNSTIVGRSKISVNKTTVLYIVQPWQSKRPIKIEEGLYVSLKKDIYTIDEIREKIVKSIVEEYPEIHVGLLGDEIEVRQYSTNIEIFGD